MTHWPYAPCHLLGGKGAYIVTAGTHQKNPLFSDGLKLKALHDGLLKYADKHSWQLQAWAVFPNHYHFVALSPDGAETAESLKPFLHGFHRRRAIWINEQNKTSGQKVWHNFWETHLTFEKSYYARLNYVHQNAVHHGMQRSIPIAALRGLSARLRSLL